MDTRSFDYGSCVTHFLLGVLELEGGEGGLSGW